MKFRFIGPAKERPGGHLGIRSLSTSFALVFLATGLSAADTIRVEYTRYTVAEDAGTVTVAATRMGDLSRIASVRYTTAALTAIAGADFEMISGTLEFAPGEEVRTVAIPILNDAEREVTEGFRFLLSEPTGDAQLASPSTALIHILPNDDGVQFVWRNWWANERDGAITAEVDRGNDRDLAPFTVGYATSNLTAVAGSDFPPTHGTLEFPAGVMRQSIVIPIHADPEVEPRERFQLTLSDPSEGISLGSRRVATLWILDTSGGRPCELATAERLAGDNAATGGILASTILGNHGGPSHPWYELIGIEVSEDLRTWISGPWLATLESDLPVVVRLAASATADPRLEAKTTESGFLRVYSASLMAAWPPPSDPDASREVQTGEPSTGVGFTERLITDPARRNRFGVSENGTFRLAIWYPCVIPPGAIPVESLPAVEMHLWLDGWEYPEDAPDFDVVAHSFRDAPIDNGRGPYPVVLYSHAGDPFAPGCLDASRHAEHLARAGFVVVAPDHYDCWASPLPDGTYYSTTTTPARNAAGFTDRMRDFEVIIQSLSRWQQDDSFFAGTLDTTRFAAMGFHWGAGVAAELCRTVETCRAGVMMNVGDWSFTGVEVLLSDPPRKPLMLVQRAGNFHKDLYSRMEADAVWFQIADSVPNSFHAWVHWNEPDRVSADRVVDRAFLAYATSFLQDQLNHGGPSDLWKGPSEDYPAVIGYERK